MKALILGFCNHLFHVKYVLQSIVFVLSSVLFACVHSVLCCVETCEEGHICTLLCALYLLQSGLRVVD